MSLLQSKCHPVGIASSSASHYNGHLNNSGTTTTDNDTNKDELSSSSSVCDVASPTEDDEDGKNENETYARIGDYNREEAAPGKLYSRVCYGNLNVFLIHNFLLKVTLDSLHP